ncbi:MAG: YdcF family protein [Pedosphaera sp.]|nr:YdcF family protein [Pedosphaera sp.]
MAKLAHLLLDPLAVIWLVLIAVLIWQIRRKQFRWAYINGLLVLFLLLFAGMPLPERLIASLERPYYREGLDAVPSADAVVVLGGFVHRHSGIEEPAGVDFSDSVDRFLTGVELLQKGKAQNLVLGGGEFGPRNNSKSEGEAVQRLLERWKISEAVVHQTGICANTQEEAVKVLDLIKRNQWKRVHLVTSAWHMRRALAVFRTAGVEAIPVACDFAAYPARESWWTMTTVLPTTSRLLVLHRYLHEEVGWLYYRSRGWISADISTAP